MNHPSYTPRGARRGEAVYYDPQSVRIFTVHDPFRLDSGAVLPEFALAYETYGELNAAKDNAILICHAFTGSSHAASHPGQDGYGWWQEMFGEGRAFDPTKHFIICSNVLGSCYGSTGPLSPDPATGKPYGARFPVVTIGDMAAAQRKLVHSFGISRLRAVIGGSMGGMQALLYGARYSAEVAACIPIACAASLSPDGIAYHAVGRRAIVVDPEWNNGDYDPENPPTRGLAIARQLAHITYLNHEAMERKFERHVAEGKPLAYNFEPEFEVERYLDYQGTSFVQRFDPNSYLYLSKAMDYFDLGAEEPLEEVLGRIQSRVLFVSYLTDGLFPIEDARLTVRALKRAGVNTTSVELPSPNGHDSFLTEIDVLSPMVRDFLRFADPQG
jgi:homoserine O-acetyltransferase